MIEFKRSEFIMINIRPVSDLRNKYPEIEELVLKEDEAVYLTKNGYGSMVVMSLEKYSNLMKEINFERAIEEQFGNADIEKDDPQTVTLYLKELEVTPNLVEGRNS